MLQIGDCQEPGHKGPDDFKMVQAFVLLSHVAARQFGRLSHPAKQVSAEVAVVTVPEVHPDTAYVPEPGHE